MDLKLKTDIIEGSVRRKSSHRPPLYVIVLNHTHSKAVPRHICFLMLCFIGKEKKLKHVITDAITVWENNKKLLSRLSKKHFIGCKHVDMMPELLQVTQQDKYQNSKKYKNPLSVLNLPSTYILLHPHHLPCSLLCSSDRYHGNEFNISPLLLAYAYCSGLAYLRLRNTFSVALEERHREKQMHGAPGL